MTVLFPIVLIRVRHMCHFRIFVSVPFSRCRGSWASLSQTTCEGPCFASKNEP